jgi:hypothetical protein
VNIKKEIESMIAHAKHSESAEKGRADHAEMCVNAEGAHEDEVYYANVIAAMHRHESSVAIHKSYRRKLESVLREIN